MLVKIAKHQFAASLDEHYVKLFVHGNVGLPFLRFFWGENGFIDIPQVFAFLVGIRGTIIWLFVLRAVARSAFGSHR
jgi:hypothetical protein